MIKMNGTVLITIPKDFSISKNADEVIYLLKKIFIVACNPKLKRLCLIILDAVTLGLRQVR